MRFSARLDSLFSLFLLLFMGSIILFQLTFIFIYSQWRSQEFRLGGARLKDKIGNKKLININNKISKELYDNLIVIQNLT